MKLCNTSDGWTNDFIYDDLTSVDINTVRDKDQYHEFLSGDNFKFDKESSARDGLFDENQIFAIFDNDDIKLLINKISACIKNI
jgi:hypothetical protein